MQYNNFKRDAAVWAKGLFTSVSEVRANGNPPLLSLPYLPTPFPRLYHPHYFHSSFLVYKVRLSHRLAQTIHIAYFDKNTSTADTDIGSLRHLGDIYVSKIDSNTIFLSFNRSYRICWY